MNSLGIYVGCSALSSLLEPSKWGLLNALEKVVGWFFFKFFYKQGHLGCLLASFPHSFFSFPPLIFEGLLKEWHVTKSRGAFSASSEQDCILSSQSMNSCVDLSRNRVTMCGETPMPENSSVTPEPTLSSHLWTAPAEVGWCLNMWVLVFHTMVLWGWWLPTQ